MSFKKKYDAAKARAVQTFQEYPLETIAVISAAAIAASKLIGATTDARNSGTWKREVKRREQNQKNS